MFLTGRHGPTGTGTPTTRLQYPPGTGDVSPSLEGVSTPFDDRALALLAGPRGQALCAAAIGLDAARLMNSAGEPTVAAVQKAVDLSSSGRNRLGPRPAPAPHLGPSRRLSATEVVSGCLSTVDLVALAGCQDEGLFVSLLADIVNDWAFFPDQVDAVDVLSDHAEALVPVATALVGAPASSWWWQAADRGAQRWVGFCGMAGPPLLGRTAEALAKWAQEPAANEDDASSWGPDASGEWWTAPLGEGLVSTSRALGDLPATELALYDDYPPDSDVVEVWELSVDSEARVYEVDGPASWCELVEAYPREVTHSRRNDWRRWTGVEGRWLVPDWARAASDWDGVHLTVAGYLASAYRALLVGNAGTCLAGWAPGVTVWLGDALSRPMLMARWDQGLGREIWSYQSYPWLVSPC